MVTVNLKIWFLISLYSAMSYSLSTLLPTNTRHCSSPTGSMDGRIVVEEDGAESADLTTLTWQIRLGETLCYRFKSETSSLVGTVEVTYVSLKSIYSILDSYQFPLVASSVQCLCDCPGGSSQCDSQTNMCSNTTNCATHYSHSAVPEGCFFKFLKLSAAMCCSIQVKQLTFKKLLLNSSCPAGPTSNQGEVPGCSPGSAEYHGRVQDCL